MDRKQAVTILKRKTTIPGDGYTWEQINEAIDMAISALSPPNESLTINELLDMNGIPLWVVDTTINRSEWCYWKNGLAYSCEAPPEYYDPDDYGQWVAYRRPLGRQEDADA